MNIVSNITNLSHKVKTSSLTLEEVLNEAYDKFFEDIRYYLRNSKIDGLEIYSLKTTKLHKHARLFDFSVFKNDTPIIIQVTISIYSSVSNIQTKIKVLGVERTITESLSEDFKISTIGLISKVYDKLEVMINR